MGTLILTSVPVDLDETVPPFSRRRLGSFLGFRSMSPDQLGPGSFIRSFHTWKSWESYICKS